jgi:hypothetical protein
MSESAGSSAVTPARREGREHRALGTAVKHPHPLVCGDYSVHKSEQALAIGEAGIRRVADHAS